MQQIVILCAIPFEDKQAKNPVDLNMYRSNIFLISCFLFVRIYMYFSSRLNVWSNCYLGEYSMRIYKHFFSRLTATQKGQFFWFFILLSMHILLYIIISSSVTIIVGPFSLFYVTSFMISCMIPNRKYIRKSQPNHVCNNMICSWFHISHTYENTIGPNLFLWCCKNNQVQNKRRKKKENGWYGFTLDVRLERRKQEHEHGSIESTGADPNWKQPQRTQQLTESKLRVINYHQMNQEQIISLDTKFAICVSKQSSHPQLCLLLQDWEESNALEFLVPGFRILASVWRGGNERTEYVLWLWKRENV